MRENISLDMAIPYKTCPVTGEHMDDGLYIRANKGGYSYPLVTDENKTLEKAIHHKCIGISPVLSDKAKADIGDGYYLVEYDAEKTSEEDIKEGNPYRTGNVIGVRRDTWERWFKDLPFPQVQWSYVPAPFVKIIRDQHKDAQP